MDPRLAEIRGVLGEQRFYPPGKHPALARAVEYRRKLAALPSSPDRDAALEHADEQIVRFEQGESDAKARTWEMLSRA